MIEVVVNNINIEANFIFIVRKEHVDQYNIDKMLKLGVSAVIVGTMAVKHPYILEKLLTKYTNEKIILGLDARDRKVSIEGWYCAIGLLLILAKTLQVVVFPIPGGP